MAEPNIVQTISIAGIEAEEKHPFMMSSTSFSTWSFFDSSCEAALFWPIPELLLPFSVSPSFEMELFVEPLELVEPCELFVLES